MKDNGKSTTVTRTSGCATLVQPHGLPKFQDAEDYDHEYLKKRQTESTLR